MVGFEEEVEGDDERGMGREVSARGRGFEKGGGKCEFGWRDLC